MKKKVRRVTIALVMTLLMGCVGLVVTLGFFADQAIESAIEVAGSEALGLCLEIAEVDLSLFSGSLSLRGLVIDNPDGYQHKKLLELESGLIQIRIKSLMADTIFIKTIKLKGVDLVVEQKGLTSNLQEVMDMIEMSKATELARKKLEIDVLEISDIRVRVKLLPVLGKMGTVTLKLPPIRMTDPRIIPPPNVLFSSKSSVTMRDFASKSISDNFFGTALLCDPLVFHECDTGCSFTITSSTKVFHSLHEGQLPSHLGDSYPQFWQKNLVFSLAK